MHVKVAGHTYVLKHIDGSNVQELKFVNRGHGCDTEGVTNQEVLRALISRVGFLNSELSWEGNSKILFHLRMALVLHEARHLEQLVLKGELNPEYVIVGDDGHFILADEE